MQLDLLGGSDKEQPLKRIIRKNDEEVFQQVLTCTNCELTGKNVPYFGPHPCKVALIGEAPGADEDRKGIPFSGPSGQLLKEELRRNKVVPERLFWMNTVSCWPPRTPKKSNIRACIGNVFAQIDLCDPQWVVLVGGVALEALAPWEYWRGKHKKITQMRCVPWSFGGRYWVPIIHPAAALRTPQYMEMFRQDVRIVVDQIRAGLPAWLEECYNCGLEVDSYDQWGMAWCKACNPRL